MELDKYKGHIPEAILIKKSYEEKHQKKRGKPRSWKLKSLEMEVDDKGRVDQDKMVSEYEQFIQDLEENPEMRFNISLYWNKEYKPSDGDESSVPLEELLADLDLSEHEDEEDNMTEWTKASSILISILRNFGFLFMSKAPPSHLCCVILQSLMVCLLKDW